MNATMAIKDTLKYTAAGARRRIQRWTTTIPAASADPNWAARLPDVETTIEAPTNYTLVLHKYVAATADVHLRIRLDGYPTTPHEVVSETITAQTNEHTVDTAAQRITLSAWNISSPAANVTVDVVVNYTLIPTSQVEKWLAEEES